MRRMRSLALMLGAASLAALSLVPASPILHGAGRTFYDDDPLLVEPDPHDASMVQPWRVGYAWDIANNLFNEPGDPATDVRAQNLNTIDEVPDSSWFTNRIGARPMSVEEITRGNGVAPPAPGPWTVVSAKSDGVTPGFVIEDTARERWFIKFDAPGHHGMATGSEVLVSRVMWALGYNVPEYYIAHFRREDLRLAPEARIEPPGYNERRMKQRDIDTLLTRVQRDADGRYHVTASKALPGTPVGRFRFYGVRPDDPNDVVPHEHRRELRALRVFSAWVNHVEMRSGNTLDTLVPRDGRRILVHHLLDFGSTLGSAGFEVRPWWEGEEYMYEGEPVLKSALTLGFITPDWRQKAFFESPAIGRLPALDEAFDPDQWKPGIPNAAFLRARPDDTFWAARRVAAFSDEVIRALVEEAEFADAAASEFIVATLVKRRDAILRAYLPRVNPVVEPTLSAAGVLTFRNAAVDAASARPPERYTLSWAEFDNATGEARDLGSTQGVNGARAPSPLPDRPGAFLRVGISTNVPAHPSWATPVDAFFRRNADGSWKLVGLRRTS